METALRLIYVKLPAEDRKVHREDKLGRFLRSTYGHSTEMGSWFLLMTWVWSTWTNFSPTRTEPMTEAR